MKRICLVLGKSILLDDFLLEVRSSHSGFHGKSLSAEMGQDDMQFVSRASRRAPRYLSQAEKR